jgi:hypothetical protein
MITPQDRTAVKLLYSMMYTESKRKYPDHPLAPKPYNLQKTSQLETAIIKLFRLYGYNSVEKTHVQGRQIGADKVTYNPITGKRQTLDKAKYIPATGLKGSADIHGPIFMKDGSPRALAIEVKNIYTNDRVRPEQSEYRRKFEADGGIYIVIRSLSEMFEWIDENLMKKIHY